MHPQVRKLLTAQQVDQRLDRLRRSLDSIPRERAQRQTALDRIGAVRDGAKARLDAAEVSQRENELSLKQFDAELQKLDTRLNTVKNNAEYQATLLQIESVKREKDKAEQEGLELLTSIDDMRAEAEAEQQKFAAAEEEFQALIREGDDFLASKAGELEKLEAEKAKRFAEVQPDVRETYDRIFAARQGHAVVKVESNTCTGCYTTIQPNLLGKLRAGTALVHCDSCQRILYVED